MKTVWTGGIRAVQAALLAAAAMAGGQALAVDTDWGRLNLSYLNYDCINGSCRIAGNILDKKANDGCVFLQVWQRYTGGTNYAPQTLVCHGSGYRYFDFDLGAGNGVVDRVLLASEWRSPVIDWQR